MHNDQDQQILNAYDQGDENRALELLMAAYQERLYHYIRRMVADHDDTDDILQNTLVRAWKGLDKFKRESKLYTWLYRIATNQTIDFINSKKRHQCDSLEDVEYQLGSSFEGNGYSGDDIQRKLDMAIQTLPDKQRAVFNLKYFEDKKYEEMSEIMGTSVGALKASYHHAVKKIENYLTAD